MDSPLTSLAVWLCNTLALGFEACHAGQAVRAPPVHGGYGWIVEGWNGNGGRGRCTNPDAHEVYQWLKKRWIWPAVKQPLMRIRNWKTQGEESRHDAWTRTKNKETPLHVTLRDRNYPFITKLWA